MGWPVRLVFQKTSLGKLKNFAILKPTKEMSWRSVALVDGTFHRFSQVMMIPVSEVEQDAEGEINVEHLMEVIRRYAAAANERV